MFNLIKTERLVLPAGAAVEGMKKWVFIYLTTKRWALLSAAIINMML